MDTEQGYTGFRWYVLVTGLICNICAMALLIAPAPLAGEMAKSLKVDLGVVLASTMMVYMVFVGVGAIVGGFLINKVGVVRMWIVCSAIQVLSTLLVPVLTYSIPGLVVVRALQGICTGPLLSSIPACGAVWFKPRERTFVAAVVGLGVSVGSAIGLVYTPGIFNIVHDWRTAVAWAAILPSIAVVLAVIAQLGGKPPVQRASEDLTAGGPEVRRIAGYGGAVVVCAVLGFINAWTQHGYNDMASGFYAVAPPVGLGLGPLGAGSRLMFASYAMAAGTIFTPLLLEKFLKGNARLTIFIGGIVAGFGVSVIRLLRVDNTALLIAVPCAVLFFSSFLSPSVFGFIAKFFPASATGKVGGLVAAAATFGGAIGLGLSSVLLSKTGFYWAAMYVLAAVALAGAFIGLALKPPRTVPVRTASLGVQALE
jgi:MFS family permease